MLRKGTEEEFRTRFKEEVQELSQYGLRASLGEDAHGFFVRVELTGNLIGEPVQSKGWKAAWASVRRMQDWVDENRSGLNQNDVLLNEWLRRKATGYSWATLTDSLNREVMNALYQHRYFPKRHTRGKVHEVLACFGFSDEAITGIIRDGLATIEKDGQAFPIVLLRRKAVTGAWQYVDCPISEQAVKNKLREPWKQYQDLLQRFLEERHDK